MHADYDPKLIGECAALIPKELEARSGKVFYAGRAAFGAPSPIYILGLDPGGHAEDHPDETIGQHTERVLHRYDEEWSALFDEVWIPGRIARTPGEAPMQKRLRHFPTELGLEPRRVPMSNVIFLRSQSEAALDAADEATAERTRPFHLRVIERLRVQLVVCLGQKAGDRVKSWLGAHEPIGRWEERNERRWAATAWSSGTAGPRVAILPQPSRADWTNPAADPSPFVRRLLEQVSSGTSASS